MGKGIGDSITIALVIAIALGIGSQNGCDFAGYTRFFGKTDLHFILLILKVQSRNFEGGIKRKLARVVNGEELLAFIRTFLGYHNHGLSMDYLWTIYGVSMEYDKREEEPLFKIKIPALQTLLLCSKLKLALVKNVRQWVRSGGTTTPGFDRDLSTL